MDPVFVNPAGQPIAYDEKKLEKQAEFNERLTITVKILRDWFTLCELGIISPDMYTDPEISNLIVRIHKDSGETLRSWGINTASGARLVRKPIVSSAKLQVVPKEEPKPNEVV